MRIAIDARLYGHKNRGLGRYVEKLIESLEKIDLENDYVIFLRRENFGEYQPKNPRFKKVLADCRWYTLKEQFLMPYLLYREKVDLVHFPHFNVPILYCGKFVMTIHDLILFSFPQKRIRVSTLGPLKYFLKEFLAKIMVKLATIRARKIITISEFSKQDIIKYLKVKPEKIEVIYLGVDGLKSNNNLAVRQFNNLLYVGSAYPHKNLERLLEAFKIVAETLAKREPSLPVRLTLVGSDDYFYQKIAAKIKELQLENLVTILYNVKDEELAKIYAQTSLFVFPSLYEGFGLPPLEAMECGVPVISSDAASLPEILGDAALYFNAQNADEMATTIIHVLNDENLRKNLIVKGFERVKKYHWDECARETLKIYYSLRNTNFYEYTNKD